MKIAFIGLGRMGWHMAAHLSRAGHAMVVCDAAPGVAQKWVAQFSGTAAETAGEAVKDCDVVCTSLPADVQLREVWNSAFAQLKSAAVWIDHSTTSAEIARVLAAQASASGQFFIDAPVSGGTVGAEKGNLAVMAGGDAAGWSLAEKVVASYAARATLIGGPGAGQLTKMANQICVAGVGQALAEGLSFAENAGLDPEKVLEVMLKGSSTSWMMENRSQPMIAGKYDFGFSTTLMRKDLALVLDEARRADASLPVTALVAQLLADVSKMGGAMWDWCSLMERQRKVLKK
ncbi:MAG: NAD(P)-dependent oxidoreductase [Sheuella sp.]|nr:NAD(P)-dependent oxidoreductase [Sheuella sp.]